MLLDMIESQTFSLIKAKMPDNIKKNYPDLDFTTSDVNPTQPKFPTVYVHLMESPESGMSTEGEDVEAVLATIQVDVIDNKNQARATEIGREALKIMKSLRFHAVVMPFSQDTEGVFRNIARYRRMIGNNDIF